MVKFSATGMISEQRRKIPLVPSKDLTGKTVVVIGANTGLGFEAAKHLARMNPGRMILGCRNQKKGEDALNAIKSNTGYEHAELWLIDLSTFASVSAFATKFEADGGRLDILVMNAGIHAYNYEASPEGHESNVQVNHLATSLLSILLTPAMLSTAQNHATTPRLVVVSSVMHFMAEFPKALLTAEDVVEKSGTLEFSDPKLMSTRYQLTKLFNVFFVRAYASHLTSPTIEALSVSPGFCDSSLGHDLTSFRQSILKLSRALLAHSSEEGSRMLVRAAVCDADELQPKAKCGKEKEKEETPVALPLNGAYLSAEEIQEPSDFVLENPAIQDNVWNDTIRILSRADPRVVGIVEELFSA